MEDFFSIPEEELRHTSRALRREFLKRGWRNVKVIRDGDTLFFATRPDGKAIRFGTSAPSTTSRFASYLADSKVATYYLLKQAGVAQPDTVWLSENKEEWGGQIAELLDKYPKIVIKPANGAHGNNVETDITSVEEALVAAEKCSSDDRYSGVIAQEQLNGSEKEVRAMCVNYELIGGYERVPATVTGDGERNILELIDYENRELRSEPYKGKPARINIEEAKHYLEKNDVDVSRVPAKGEAVQVMKICNVGVGGTMKYVEMSEEQKELSEKVARLFELPVIGIDFYGDKIIEVNASPALHCPTNDEWADICVEKYVDYLETL